MLFIAMQMIHRRTFLLNLVILANVLNYLDVQLGGVTFSSPQNLKVRNYVV